MPRTTTRKYRDSLDEKVERIVEKLIVVSMRPR